VFDEKWQQDRPWLQYTDNAMICTLCKKHSKCGTWSSSGCVTLRLDTVKEHVKATLLGAVFLIVSKVI
jgi:hypothetical protein